MSAVPGRPLICCFEQVPKGPPILGPRKTKDIYVTQVKEVIFKFAGSIMWTQTQNTVHRVREILRDNLRIFAYNMRNIKKSQNIINIPRAPTISSECGHRPPKSTPTIFETAVVGALRYIGSVDPRRHAPELVGGERHSESQKHGFVISASGLMRVSVDCVRCLTSLNNLNFLKGVDQHVMRGVIIYVHICIYIYNIYIYLIMRNWKHYFV